MQFHRICYKIPQGMKFVSSSSVFARLVGFVAAPICVCLSVITILIHRQAGRQAVRASFACRQRGRSSAVRQSSENFCNLMLLKFFVPFKAAESLGHLGHSQRAD